MDNWGSNWDLNQLVSWLAEHVHLVVVDIGLVFVGMWVDCMIDAGQNCKIVLKKKISE